MTVISRAVVIGAGTMGGGIAASLAGGGVQTLLLDVAGDGPDRSARARAGLARQVEIGAFPDPAAAGLVEVGNLDDDLGRVAEADWIVEVVVEDRAVKQALYRRLEALRKPDGIVSSNTSTILRAALVEGLGADFARHFFITHFFNPPHLMKLVELVCAPDSDAAAYERLKACCETVMGKTAITCADRPGFIANRLGCFWMSVAILEARRFGLTVEEADAVAGLPFGVPRTGIFALMDLIGIDLIEKVWPSLLGALPATDRHQRFRLPEDPTVRRLTADGRLGRKTGAGFYRQRTVDGTKLREAVDLSTGAYRPATAVDQASIGASPADLAALVARDDRFGGFARSLLGQVVAYAREIVPEVTEDPAAVDAAMRFGYNWSLGPFALAEAVGADVLRLALDAAG